MRGYLGGYWEFRLWLLIDKSSGRQKVGTSISAGEGFTLWGLGLRVWSFGVWGLGFGFRVWALRNPESWNISMSPHIPLYGCFPKLGVPSWGPYNKDYNVWGSILSLLGDTTISPFRPL